MSEDPHGLPASAWLPGTKFVRPLPTKDAVIDPALLDRVERSLTEVPFTLIIAQAGAGKTTLAAAAVDRLAAPVAWISLDEFDDDPQAFLQLLVLALDAEVPGCCPVAGELMASGLPSTVDPVRMVGVLINDLVDRDATPAVLVLDDLHVLKPSGVAAALEYLLARLPGNLRLLATARNEPPMSLVSRLRSSITSRRISAGSSSTARCSTSSIRSSPLRSPEGMTPRLCWLTFTAATGSSSSPSTWPPRPVGTTTCSAPSSADDSGRGSPARDQAIADQLIISQNTVKTHVRSVMTKLGARSRGEAVAAARLSHLL